jgi:hypothetical protein
MSQFTDQRDKAVIWIKANTVMFAVGVAVFVILLLLVAK